MNKFMNKKIVIIVRVVILVMLFGYFIYNNFGPIAKKNDGKSGQKINNIKEDGFLYESPNHNGIGMNSTVLYGYISSTGSKVIDYKFIKCQDNFKKGTFAWIQSSSTLYGYIDSKGKIKVKPKYLYASKFIENYAVVEENNDKYSFIKIENNKIVEVETNKVPSETNKLLMDEYQQNYENKIINNENNIGFESIEKLSTSGETLKALKINNKKISGFIYTKIEKSTNSQISVSTGRETFFVGNNGKKIKSLPTVKGNGVLKHIGNLILVDINDTYSYITKDGTKVWEEKKLQRNLEITLLDKEELEKLCILQ